MARWGTDVELTAPGKLAALLAVIVGCFAYILVMALGHGDADTTPAWATITLVSGYLIGNGVGAKRGVPQAPTFAPKANESGSVEPER